ncbi:MAG: 5'-methylthioadenosine/adenosylhomocysteine nucleosidase [Clostridiales bacterium]|nr:5'-methylthioadenosine/adenosylhomocysteine nucleosidase [Clostridiales bacterium]
MLGIIGAMDEEVAKLKEMIENLQIVYKSGMDFFSGKIEGTDVVVVKCGVGKVNAAMCTQTMIDVFDVTGIINTGIAGSLDADINIGDIVLASDTLEHDMDVAALGYGPGIIPDTSVSVFKTDEYLMDIAMQAVKASAIDVTVFTGRVVSGDQFISSKEKKEWLVSTFGGRCAEMEGAAIGHVAVLNSVPYLVVRAISDKADDSAQMDYPTFAARAIDNSVRMMTEIIRRYEVKR